MPLVPKRNVDLLPVVTVFAILSFGILFGSLGVFVSTPLTVVLYVAVKAYNTVPRADLPFRVVLTLLVYSRCCPFLAARDTRTLTLMILICISNTLCLESDVGPRPNHLDTSESVQPV